MRLERIGAVLLGIALFSLPSEAMAQTRAWEVSGGYAYMTDPQDATSFPAGWVVGAGIGLTSWCSAIVEAGYSWQTISEIHLNTSAIMVGARASTRLGPFAEFAQLEVGAARAGATVFDLKTANTAFAFQAGGGIDYPVAGPFAARFQVEYRVVPHAATDQPHFARILLALVYTRRLH
jgi:hypothetical protein